MRVTARVRFDTAAFHEGAEGYVEFGSLCDKMRGLSQTVGCTFSGPRLGVYDPRQTERVAISKAIEEAYPSAEAAAHIMPAHIVSVQRVNVEEVSWDKSEDWRGAGPGLRRSVCTARVRVTYVFATGP